MSGDSLLLEKQGSLATITFNRPEKANAMDVGWLAPITAFLRDIEYDPAMRCVLLRGNGKHFMAGGDLDIVRKFAAQPPEKRAGLSEVPIHEYNVMVRVMRRLDKPVIASVQGGVAGAAVGLVAACDLVVAAENAFFFLAHVLHAGSNDGLTTYFLPRQLGTRKALELALLGDRLGAADAQRLGLINFVVPLELLESETHKLIDRLSAGPTRTYGLIKTLMDSSLDNSMEAQGRLEAECYAKAAMTADLVEGIDAFMEKRPPRFSGR
jgi:2-(1,2-epoxy-1,2-dihydrophenyl)acetyl-CoA isomerase